MDDEAWLAEARAQQVLADPSDPGDVPGLAAFMVQLKEVVLPSSMDYALEWSYRDSLAASDICRHGSKSRRRRRRRCVQLGHHRRRLIAN